MTRRTLIFMLIRSLALGAAASIVFAMVAPHLLPAKNRIFCAGNGALRALSWSFEGLHICCDSCSYAPVLDYAHSLDWNEGLGPPGTFNSSRLWSWRIEHTGFPMRSLAGWRVEPPLWSADGRVIPARPARSGGVFVLSSRRISNSYNFESWIVFNPIWSGLLINAIVWAIPFFLLGASVHAIRTRRLARKHLCSHCAYDLSATPLDRPCPECGRIASARRPGGPQSKEPSTHN